MAAHNRTLGAAGERRAMQWYLDHGYQVLARNWRCRAGEVDLIVQRGAVVAFVEVKARSSTAFGHPAEAVTPAKQQRLRGLGAAWLAEHPDVHPGEVRFDVVAIVGEVLEVLEAAF